MAGDGKVQIDFASADASLQAAWEAQNRAIDKLTLKLANLEAKSKEGKQASVDWTDSAVAGLARMAAGLMSVGTAMEIITQQQRITRDEYRRFIELGQTAAEFQMPMAKLAQQAIINLGNASDITGPQLEQIVNDIAFKTGAKRETIWGAASSVLSASTAFPSSEAMNQLGEVAGLVPFHEVDAIKDIAGTALDLRKQFGGTAKEMTGVLFEASKSSRAEGIQDFGRNVAPVIASMGKFGSDLQTAVAMSSALSQEAVDKSGRVSSNALINFAKQLQQATAQQLPERASPGERLEYLLSGDPRAEAIRKGLMSQFTGQAAFAALTPGGALNVEAKPYMAIMELLKGGKTYQTYKDILAKTPTLETGDEAVDAIKKQFEGVDVIKTGMASLDMQRLNEGLKGIAVTGESGAVSTGLREALTQMGGFGVSPTEPLGGWSLSGLPSIWNFLTGERVGVPVVDREMEEAVDLESSGMTPQEAALEIIARRRRQHARNLENESYPTIETQETQAIQKMLDAWEARLRGKDKTPGANDQSSARMMDLLEQIAANTADKGVTIKDDEQAKSVSRRTPNRHSLRGLERAMG